MRLKATLDSLPVTSHLQIDKLLKSSNNAELSYRPNLDELESSGDEEEGEKYRAPRVAATHYHEPGDFSGLVYSIIYLPFTTASSAVVFSYQITNLVPFAMLFSSAYTESNKSLG